MSERTYRLILGFILWASLVFSAYYETITPIYIFSGFLLFEGITNLRLTTVINYFRFHQPIYHKHSIREKTNWLFKVDSERILRIIIAVFVSASLMISPDLFWFLPWFVTGMLILAGITNLCPMIMLLKWAGFK